MPPTLWNSEGKIQQISKSSYDDWQKSPSWQKLEERKKEKPPRTGISKTTGTCDKARVSAGINPRASCPRETNLSGPAGNRILSA